MKDKNNIEIKAGDLVKRAGYVQYADGKRYKISKKTWLVSKVEDGKIYYKEATNDYLGRPIEQELELTLAEGVEVVVIGDEKGVKDEFKNTVKELGIEAGSVAEKYEVLKDVPKYKWLKGDVVSITGKVSFDTLEKGLLKKVDVDTPHKHVLVVADVARIKGKQK